MDTERYTLFFGDRNHLLQEVVEVITEQLLIDMLIIL